MRDTRTFPIQTERGAAPHPLRIPWALAERAYSVYAGRYGRNQSLARLGERGGFAPSEMDEFLPGWREEADECAALRARIAALSVAARGVLVHFGPRHLDAVSGAEIGTALKRALVSFGFDREAATRAGVHAVTRWCAEHPWEPSLDPGGGSARRKREHEIMQVALDAALRAGTSEGRHV